MIVSMIKIRLKISLNVEKLLFHIFFCTFAQTNIKIFNKNEKNV
jgi:hypothetical protein